MFNQIFELENIVKSFRDASQGRHYSPAVLRFSHNLEYQLINIQTELSQGNFTPLPYNHFIVCEPKKRHIAAPAFHDIVVQHALFNIINPLFEKQFIFDSYACRIGKGTHFGAKRVKKFLRAKHSLVTKNQPQYFLKCDIARFFPSIDWEILLKIIKRTILCPKTDNLIRKIVTIHKVLQTSMNKGADEVVFVKQKKGLPIGNLTSQLFANIYLNELDRYLKTELKVRWYGRYMDDFVIIDSNKERLKTLKVKIVNYLANHLKLKAHPNKTFIGNCVNGVDFLGYRIFHNHILVRGKTLRNIYKRYKMVVKRYKDGKISESELQSRQASFMGHLKHADTYWLKKFIFKNENDKIQLKDNKT